MALTFLLIRQFYSTFYYQYHADRIDRTILYDKNADPFQSLTLKSQRKTSSLTTAIDDRKLIDTNNNNNNNTALLSLSDVENGDIISYYYDHRYGWLKAQIHATMNNNEEQQNKQKLQIFLFLTCEIETIEFNPKRIRKLLDHRHHNNIFLNSCIYTHAEPRGEIKLPLEPPYRIVQMGMPRTGSTLQYHVLDKIISLKERQRHLNFSNKNSELSSSPPAALQLHRAHIVSFDDWMNLFYKYGDTTSSFLVKTHKKFNFPSSSAQHHNVSSPPSIAVFASIQNINQSKSYFPSALITQTRENLLSCSLCEVDKYKPIFNLTDTDIKNLKYYLERYMIIRRCCGLQMSKYEVLRLNGCNMEEVRKTMAVVDDYPWCEQYNKSQIEIELVNNPGGITHHELHPKLNWNNVGDCQHFDTIISSGKGFNGAEFDGRCSTD